MKFVCKPSEQCNSRLGERIEIKFSKNTIKWNDLKNYNYIFITNASCLGLNLFHILSKHLKL